MKNVENAVYVEEDKCRLRLSLKQNACAGGVDCPEKAAQGTKRNRQQKR
ncbi:MAG: hypothetical protein HUU32_22665 [Calditrichaceae bacterium]|nr:hypothetical protein [Calditrichaceae bacterium]